VIDPERLAAFALMTGATSLVPGLSMLFVMGQAARQGWRSGAFALTGMQLGYIAWWALAALGLGTLAAAWPLAFRVLALGGAVYLGWLGLQAIRHAGEGASANGEPTAVRPSHHAFRDGILVALGNPKSLVYIVALLPPFVDARAPVVPQLALFWFIAMAIDLAIGAVYIGAGGRLARAMHRPQTRRRVDLAVGAIYLAIAIGVIGETMLHAF
jgi:homoserine/homoserine lactone efflux protein